MLTYSTIQGYGFGALAMTIDEARSSLESLKKILRSRFDQFPADTDFDDVFVYSINDPATQGNIIRLSELESSNLDVASTVLAKDIQNKTGITTFQLMDQNAFPRMGSAYRDMLSQIDKLLKAQRDATGAARFPIGATLGTIIGVSVIGGLVVWGMGKSSSGRRRR